MANYATREDIEKGFGEIAEDKLEHYLEEAAVIIDAYAKDASPESKKTVTIRMVRRALASEADAQVPMGATQGSVSAMGYSQSWTVSGGSTGELYLEKLEKKILGVGNKLRFVSQLEARNDD